MLDDEPEHNTNRPRGPTSPISPTSPTSATSQGSPISRESAAPPPVLHRQRFANRREAGQVLAQVLQALGLQNPTVLALPRGGVPVAAEVARVLGAPLDLLMVRKIGAPGQPELAVAAMAALGTGATDSGDERSGPPAQTFVDPALMAATGADQAHVDRGVAREGAELARRRRLYLRGRRPMSLDGCTVIVVDDGIATGTTLRAALKALRAPATDLAALQGLPDPGRRQASASGGPLAVVLAVPVAPAQVLVDLAGEVDATVCLWTPEPFVAVGAHYRDFRQVSDEEVVEALASSP
jgi:putative phosphoribosyl transferase